MRGAAADALAFGVAISDAPPPPPHVGTPTFPHMLSTRKAVEADAPAIKALIDLFVPDGTLLPRSEEFIVLHAEDFLVVTEDDRILGCIHLDEYAPSIAEIRSVSVAGDVQGRGVGDALMAGVERLARQRQISTLFAVTNRTKYFFDRGFVERRIPELYLERSEVSRYKAVCAKDL